MKWQEYILDEFPAEPFSQISILNDPEALVAEEEIFAVLTQRGYILHDFNDKMFLRYVYEHQIRRTENKVIIIVRDAKYPVEEIPYDIFKQARIVSVSISDLFPRLNFTVVRGLERKHIANLFESRASIPLGINGEYKTCEFLLENIFSFSVESINKDRAFLTMLFWLHCDWKLENIHLQKHIARQLTRKPSLKHWDVEKLVTSANNFWDFLQERWEYYIKEQKSCDTFKFRGPVDLPFDNNAIRPRIFSLLSAGKINTDSIEGIQKIAEYLSGDTSYATMPIISDLQQRIQHRIPAENSSFDKWLEFAEDWADLTSLYAASGKFSKEFKQLQGIINTRFKSWLDLHFSSLASLPPQTPVLVNQIIRSVSRKIDNGSIKKFALIVIDGLALNQWAAIRPDLEKCFEITSNACFAWIPTLTSISRQAIFSGKVPALFEKSINTTSQEPVLWQHAWEEYGFNKSEILYTKALGNDDPKNILDMIGPKIKICGFVVDTVDKIMHGMQLGATGMHNQIKQWMQKEYLKSLITGLINMGFNVVITSDHGNIECRGSGKLQDGILSETKGERVRIYSDKNIADNAVVQYQESFAGITNGLPAGMFPVMLSGDNAFAAEGTISVAHGGCSIEEVIVPIINITEKKE